MLTNKGKQQGGRLIGGTVLKFNIAYKGSQTWAWVLNRFLQFETERNAKKYE